MQIATGSQATVFEDLGAIDYSRKSMTATRLNPSSTAG
jgi:hypothetical protein